MLFGALDAVAMEPTAVALAAIFSEVNEDCPDITCRLDEDGMVPGLLVTVEEGSLLADTSMADAVGLAEEPADVSGNVIEDSGERGVDGGEESAY